MINIVNSI